MAMTFPSPLLQLTLAGVLTAAPTGATPAGLYTQIGGMPPSGIALGDIFSWSGSSAILYRAFSNAPSAITVNAASWSKTAGTWAPDVGLTVRGVLTAAPVAGTAAGLWATNAAFGPASAGDLVYLPGGVSTGTRYLSFADAPAVLASADNTFAKIGSVWAVVGAAATPAFGQVIIPAQTTAALFKTWADVTGGSVTVPSAGTWFLAYSLKASAGSGQWWNASLSDSLGNQVPGTQTQVTVVGSMQSVSAQALVTTTGPRTFKLQVLSYNWGAVTIPNNTSVVGENQAQSNLVYFKVA